MISPFETNVFQGNLGASWELDVFGGIRRGVQAATADVAAAEENRRDVLVIFLGDVGRVYAQLRGFQRRLEIADKNIKTQQDTLDLTTARSKAGLATELDVSRAAAQLESTRAVVPSLLSETDVLIHRLSVLLGEEPGGLRPELEKTSPIPSAGPDVEVGLPSDLVVVAGVAGVFATTAFMPGQAGPIRPYVSTMPEGYRDWRWISSAHEAANLNSLGAVLGNDVAVEAYRERAIPFPDGTIIAALHYVHAPNTENNKIFGRAQSFVPGPPTNIQFLVKDSIKYAATGGWGFGHFPASRAWRHGNWRRVCVTKMITPERCLMIWRGRSLTITANS